MKHQRGIAVILVFALLIAVGVFLGRLFAHDEISAECERLGGFYNGSTVYRCEVKRP